MRVSALISALGVAACACAATQEPPAPAPAAAPDPYAPRRAMSGAVAVEYWARAPEVERGLPVLLVPGMTGHADSWRAHPALIDGLLAAGHRVIAVSLRGRGGSASPERGWTFEDHVADLESVVAAEHLTRWHVVAHSMGVAYGLGLAARDPSRIASFTAGDYVPLVMTVTEAWVSAVGGDADNRHRYDRRLARRVFDEQGPPLGTLGKESFVRDLRPALPALAAPVLYLQATHGVPEERLRQDAAAWSGAPALTVLGVDAGHAVFAHPDAVNATLKATAG